MADYLFTARSDKATFTPTANNGGATITGVNFTYTCTNTVGNAKFSHYVNGATYDRFDSRSKIYLYWAKVSIPNLRGVQPVKDPGVSPTVLIRNLPTGGTPTTAFLIPLRAFDEEIPLGFSISTPKAGEKFAIDLNTTTIRLDNRNIQSIYSGIDVFVQIQIYLASPFTPSFT